MSISRELFEWVPVMYMDSAKFKELQSRGEKWYGEDILCVNVRNSEYCGAHLLNYDVNTPYTSPEATMTITNIPVYTVLKLRHRIKLKFLSRSRYGCTHTYLLYIDFKFYRGNELVELCNVDNPNECYHGIETNTYVTDAPGYSDEIVEFYITEDRVFLAEIKGFVWRYRLTSDPDSMSIELRFNLTRSSCNIYEQWTDLLLYCFDYSIRNPFAEHFGIMLDLIIVGTLLNVILFSINMFREAIFSPSEE